MDFGERTAKVVLFCGGLGIWEHTGDGSKADGEYRSAADSGT